MEKYPKIQTVYKRDPENKFKTLLDGEFSTDEFHYLQDARWIGTEKINGTNIRIMNTANVVYKIGGKTDAAQIPSFLFPRLQEIGKRLLKLEIDNCCLYGEGYGAKIQKGGGNYIPDGCDYILFDVKIGDVWLKREDVEDIAKKLDIDMVSTVFHGTLIEAVDFVKDGFNSHSSINIIQAEGLVLRPVVELLDRMGKRIITKIKYKDFNRR